jgi:hypothetical protein
MTRLSVPDCPHIQRIRLWHAILSLDREPGTRLYNDNRCNYELHFTTATDSANTCTAQYVWHKYALVTATRFGVRRPSSGTVLQYMLKPKVYDKIACVCVRVCVRVCFCGCVCVPCFCYAIWISACVSSELFQLDTSTRSSPDPGRRETCCWVITGEWVVRHVEKKANWIHKQVVTARWSQCFINNNRTASLKGILQLVFCDIRQLLQFVELLTQHAHDLPASTHILRRSTEAVQHRQNT